ncbi:MAG: hypothetical protein QXU99_04960 [Candidatus Bathyarchaeia archaeon]
MKLNIIGVVGGILAFVSLALPWWTMSMSSSMFGMSFSVDVSVYPYQATMSALGMAESAEVSIWFGWVALALVIIGGVIGIIASLMPGKTLLIVGGLLALVSVIIFAVGIQLEIANALAAEDLPVVGLFGSGTYTYSGTTMNYSAFLSFGFWIALVAGILMLIASRKTPVATVTPPPPPPPPMQQY